jgi:hypothetical protein
MKNVDPVVFRELPIIRKIIEDETWLEGERRGCYVRASDPIVRHNVCEVILRVGEELRQSLSRDQHGPLLGLPGLHLPAVSSRIQDAA